MQPNKEYFQRNRGNWTWRVRFGINDWGQLRRSSIGLINKFRIVALVLGPKLLGAYRLKTHVTIEEEQVSHVSTISKWGMPIFRSEKIFALDKNGKDFTISGQEFYWPRMKKAISCGPFQGMIQPCSTQAIYHMPLMNIPCQWHAILNLEQAKMHIDGGWIKGEFAMTEESIAQLRSRFQQSI